MVGCQPEPAGAGVRRREGSLIMTITYEGELQTPLDLVRFYLGDTVDGSGPLPGDGNFQDSEIVGLVAIEGSWQRAVAAGFETLAARWANHTDFEAGSGMEAKLSKITEAYQEQATDWRTRFGTPSTHKGGQATMVREDPYSYDLDNVQR